MKTIVWGFGSIGRKHYHVLNEILKHEVEIVSKRELKGFSSYRNIEVCIKKFKPDYIVVCSETIRHFEDLKKLEELNFPGKILVEKPLFSKFDRNSFFKFNENIFVGYNLRFHSVIQKVKELIKNQKVLTVNSYVGQYLPDWRPNTDYRECYSAFNARGGGVTKDLSHEIDFIQWLFGVLSDFSFINKKVSNLEIDSDDICIFTGVTNASAVVSVQMSYLDRIPRRHLIINTDEDTIFANLISGDVQTKSDFFKCEIDVYESYVKMHENIFSEENDLCTLVEGLEVLEVICKIKDE